MKSGEARKPSKRVVPIRLTPQVIRMFQELCELERRGQSNMIEVLIAERHQQVVENCDKPKENNEPVAVS